MEKCLALLSLSTAELCTFLKVKYYFCVKKIVVNLNYFTFKNSGIKYGNLTFVYENISTKPFF